MNIFIHISFFLFILHFSFFSDFLQFFFTLFFLGNFFRVAACSSFFAQALFLDVIGNIGGWDFVMQLKLLAPSASLAPCASLTLNLNSWTANPKPQTLYPFGPSTGLHVEFSGGRNRTLEVFATFRSMGPHPLHPPTTTQHTQKNPNNQFQNLNNQLPKTKTFTCN